MNESEAAYAEALRRIQEAKKTRQHWLDLGDLDSLEEIPRKSRN